MSTGVERVVEDFGHGARRADRFERVTANRAGNIVVARRPHGRADQRQAGVVVGRRIVRTVVVVAVCLAIGGIVCFENKKFSILSLFSRRNSFVTYHPTEPNWTRPERLFYWVSYGLVWCYQTGPISGAVRWFVTNASLLQ